MAKYLPPAITTSMAASAMAFGTIIPLTKREISRDSDALLLGLLGNQSLLA